MWVSVGEGEREKRKEEEQKSGFIQVSVEVT